MLVTHRSIRWVRRSAETGEEFMQPSFNVGLELRRNVSRRAYFGKHRSFEIVHYMLVSIICKKSVMILRGGGNSIGFCHL